MADLVPVKVVTDNLIKSFFFYCSILFYFKLNKENDAFVQDNSFSDHPVDSEKSAFDLGAFVGDLTFEEDATT